TWRDAAPAGAAQTARTNRLVAQRLEMEFDSAGRPEKVLGHNGTEIHRASPGGAEQVASAQELAVSVGAKGQWTQIVQTGNFRLADGGRNARAERAVLDNATDVLTLTGTAKSPAEVTDAQSDTKADSFAFHQATGEIQGEGHVVTTYSNAAPAQHLAPEPANISADHLAANSKDGKAAYTGHARLWQGSSLIEGQTITLDRAAREISAQGDVHAVFLQVPPPTGPAPAKGANGGDSPAASSDKGMDLWHIRAGKLTYFDGESRAHLEEGFTAESQQGKIAAQSGELYFSKSGGAGSGTGIAGGASRVSRATATGKVNIRQKDLRGTSEHADYTAADGKFVLSGGNPTLYDSHGNTTSGRQLTFFLASDTILVQSEEGLQALPRHRVEK
ncbi:MAG: LptA/OstA family protein, partial [Bryobacteraceae bacterium]